MSSVPSGSSAAPPGRKSPWKRFFIHVFGIALVLNSINTYGFQYFFPGCANHYGLAPDCSSYGAWRGVLETLGAWYVVNVLIRFMALLGFALDALALWYLIYLGRTIYRSVSRR